MWGNQWFWINLLWNNQLPTYVDFARVFAFHPGPRGSMGVSPYTLLKILRNDRSFSTLLNRFFRIADMNSILFSSEKNKVSNSGVISSVNYNERHWIYCSLFGTSKLLKLHYWCVGCFAKDNFIKSTVTSDLLTNGEI